MRTGSDARLIFEITRFTFNKKYAARLDRIGQVVYIHTIKIAQN